MLETNNPQPSPVRSLTWVMVGQAYFPDPSYDQDSIKIMLLNGYKKYLEKLGHKVIFINTQDRQEIIDRINQCRPDIVHVHKLDMINYPE